MKRTGPISFSSSVFDDSDTPAETVYLAPESKYLPKATLRMPGSV